MNSSSASASAAPKASFSGQTSLKPKIDRKLHFAFFSFSKGQLFDEFELI